MITVKSLTAGIPTGTGSLFGNARMSGTAPLNTAGQTALTFSRVTPGSFMVGASYSGDANYQPSVGSLMNRFSVGRYASTTILTSSTNPVTAGQSVTFTASISSACYNAGGTDFVTFKNGLATLGTASVSNGLATFTTSSLPAGADKIIATFAGDSNLLASTSNTLTETVSNFATTTTLTSSANPSTYGQNVMFTASVSATSGGAPGGTIHERHADLGYANSEQRSGDDFDNDLTGRHLRQHHGGLRRRSESCRQHFPGFLSGRQQGFDYREPGVVAEPVKFRAIDNTHRDDHAERCGNADWLRAIQVGDEVTRLYAISRRNCEYNDGDASCRF